jgi:hypothetical protein
MKKYPIPIAFAIALALTAILFLLNAKVTKNIMIQQAMASSEAALAQLPDDLGRAQKELRRVERALAKLNPSKPYIVIDRHANKLSLRTEDSVLFEATCSTGSGGTLVDSASGRQWIFQTPAGVFHVDSKLVNPWWRKPDWAFYEDNEKIPKDPRDRYDSEMLGDYALGFGNGYFIHGTIYERLLGISVTHGCVRLGSKDLKFLYNRVDIGTPVYVF